MNNEMVISKLVRISERSEQLANDVKNHLLLEGQIEDRIGDLRKLLTQLHKAMASSDR